MGDSPETTAISTFGLNLSPPPGGIELEISDRAKPFDPFRFHRSTSPLPSKNAKQAVWVSSWSAR